MSITDILEWTLVVLIFSLAAFSYSGLRPLGKGPHPVTVYRSFPQWLLWLLFVVMTPLALVAATRAIEGVPFFPGYY